jgi:hypothetical protein
MTKYYILLDGEKKGPYALSQLRKMWDSGAITMDTKYVDEGMTEWADIVLLMAEESSQPNATANLDHRSTHLERMAEWMLETKDRLASRMKWLEIGWYSLLIPGFFYGLGIALSGDRESFSYVALVLSIVIVGIPCGFTLHNWISKERNQSYQLWIFSGIVLVIWYFALATINQPLIGEGHYQGSKTETDYRNGTKTTTDLRVNILDDTNVQYIERYEVKFSYAGPESIGESRQKIYSGTYKIEELHAASYLRLILPDHPEGGIVFSIEDGSLKMGKITLH